MPKSSNRASALSKRSDIAIMGFIAPELKAEWGITNRELGLIISAALVGLALGAMLSGPLSDRLGRKVVIINSVFFFGAWTLITAFSQNMEQMILFRFLTGLGLSAAMPNVGTLVAEFAPARRRAFLITVVFCGFTFGAALGGFAASWLMLHFGWHFVLDAGRHPADTVRAVAALGAAGVSLLFSGQACRQQKNSPYSG